MKKDYRQSSGKYKSIKRANTPYTMKTGASDYDPVLRGVPTVFRLSEG